MPATGPTGVIELFDSGSGSLSTEASGTFSRDVNLKWLLKDIVSYQAAEDKGKELAPDVFSGHYRSRLDVAPLGSDWWMVTATYSRQAITPDEDPQQNQDEDLFPASVSFDTTGGQEHITQAYTDSIVNVGQGERSFGDGAPSYYGAINVSGQQVNGLDVVAPVFNFTETWTIPTVWMTDEYVSTLYSLTGKVNDATFRVFEAGECLFLGARAEIARGDFRSTVTFSFSARPNEASKAVGGIEVTNKKGWEYLWIQYEDEVDNANLIKRPKYVYVDAIYPEGDFSLLGIGTNFPSLYTPAATGPAIY